MLAMERYFKEHPVPELYVQLNGSTKACNHSLPPLKALTHPVAGWMAVSERTYRLNQGPIRQDPCAALGAPSQTLAPSGWLDWLKRYEPVAIVGKTVRLYRVAKVQ